MQGSANRSRTIRAALVMALVTAGGASAQNNLRPTNRPITPQTRCVDDEAKRVAAEDLARAILAAVQALPASRSSAEDIEATILYTISQRSLCPGVAQMALASLTSGTPAFRQAVAHVQTSLINTPAGTAGIVDGGSGGSFTQFTSPIVGLGGGSSNYSN